MLMVALDHCFGNEVGAAESPVLGAAGNKTGVTFARAFKWTGLEAKIFGATLRRVETLGRRLISKAGHTHFIGENLYGSCQIERAIFGI